MMSPSSMRFIARSGRAAPVRAAMRAWTPAATSTPRFFATASEDAPPPMLSKLKGDLKTAMRAKDGPRLAVLRTIMSANLNASKTASPIRTDIQLVGMIRKLQKSAHDSLTDAREAGREDLVEKEKEQISIYDQYLAESGVQSLGEAELASLVQSTVDAVIKGGAEARAATGEIMKRLKAALEGKDVDMKEVSKLVKETMQK